MLVLEVEELKLETPSIFATMLSRVVMKRLLLTGILVLEKITRYLDVRTNHANITKSTHLVLKIDRGSSFEVLF